MLRLILFLSVITFTFSTFSQKSFNYQNDFDNLLLRSEDSSDKLSYKNLLLRFQSNDSTLTNHEVLALMIGFTSSPNYTPYKTLDKEDEILGIVRSRNYKLAIEKCDSLLNKNPLNYVALMEKGYSLWKIDSTIFKKYKYQSAMLFDAIMASGDGSAKNPYFVLGPTDGQIIIEYVMGGTITSMGSGRDENDNFIDILTRKSKDGEITELHFIIEHAIKNSGFYKEIQGLKKNIKYKQ